MLKFLIIACLILGNQGLYAQSAKRAGGEVQSVSLNLGTHTEFYNSVQDESSGGVRKFEINPTIGAGMIIPIDGNFNFLPEVNWMLPFFKSNEAIIKNLFMIRADFGYDFTEWFRFRLGTSLMWQNMHGKGGKKEINNGGSTSTFYYPDENRSSLNNTFDLGAEFLFNKEWSARVQTYTYSLFEEESRQISYSLFVTHYFDWSK